jgi:hypothetical protein
MAAGSARHAGAARAGGLFDGAFTRNGQVS